MSKTINVMLINNRNDSFEKSYQLEDTDEDTKAVFYCLDDYISDVLGFERTFKANETLWATLKAKEINSDMNHRFTLANSLCKSRRYKLKRIYYKHVYNYRADSI